MGRGGVVCMFCGDSGDSTYIIILKESATGRSLALVISSCNLFAGFICRKKRPF